MMIMMMMMITGLTTPAPLVLGLFDLLLVYLPTPSYMLMKVEVS